MSSALDVLGFEKPGRLPSGGVEQAGRGLGWRHKCAVGMKQGLK